jgi:hypothetical protein
MVAYCGNELSKETGLSTLEVAPEGGWHAIFAGMRIAMLKVLHVPVPAAAPRDQIFSWLDAARARRYPDC